MTIAGRAPLERIAVIGGGQVALLAAIAIKRAVPGAIVAIADAPVAPVALADRAHTTLPSLARLHERIGIDEAGMIARAGASHRLATRYTGWSGGEWLLAYGSAPAQAGFMAQWAGDAVAQSERPAGVAGALALAGRFARPSDDAGAPLSDLDYALRFDPAGHVRRLRSLAAHLGIAVGAADADLVIDTRAASADGGWIDWSSQLPGRHVEVQLQTPHLSTLDEIAAMPDGYTMISPGRDSTRHVSVRFDDGAFRPGRLPLAWTGNAIAIGDAAAVFEPIGWCNLHLAVCQIELLLELLPGRVIDPLERAEYNRRAAMLADRVRDFVAAHHAQRPGLERSDGLARTLGEFTRRGRLPYFEEDSVPGDLWMQLLTAVCPDHAPSPVVLAMTDEVRIAERDAQWRHVAAALAAAEPYPQWFAKEAAR